MWKGRFGKLYADYHQIKAYLKQSNFKKREESNKFFIRRDEYYWQCSLNFKFEKKGLNRNKPLNFVR